jgi:hypothetical protein
MAVTPAQKRRIKEEAGFKCAVPNCNTTSPLDIHHIQYKENGGLDEDDNLICLCKNCHGRVHDNEIPNISIRTFKARLQRVSFDLYPHEIKYLEALFSGEQVELDDNTVVLARRIERRGLIRITHRVLDNVYCLNITGNGRAFIE